MAVRPRLSPKSPGDLNRPDYFPAPSASAAAAPAPAPASKVSSSSRHHASSSTTPQPQHAPSSAHNTFSLNSAAAAAAPPPASSSPSSRAFTANFDSLMREPATGGAGSGSGPQAAQAGLVTPLDAPASSPFFPGLSNPTAAAAGKEAGSTGQTTGLAPAVGSRDPPRQEPADSSTKAPTLPFARRTSSTAAGAMPVQSNRYTLFSPQHLVSSLLASSTVQALSPEYLVLDIRPRTAFLTERLAGSINVCVPSTLLRRQTFGVDRVQDSLPPADQRRFAVWQASDSPCRGIIVLDQESNALVETGGPVSLLAKFEKAGFEGQLGWVKGGWVAVRNAARSLAQSPEERGRLLESGERDEELVEEDEGGDSKDADMSPKLPTNGRPQMSLSDMDTSSPALHSPGLTGVPGSKKHARTAPGAAGSPSREDAPPPSRPALSSASSGSSGRRSIGASGGFGVSGGAGSSRPVLQVRDLPASAFQVASTTAYRTNGGASNSAAVAGSPEKPGPLRAAAPGAANGFGGKRRRPGFEQPSLLTSHASAFAPRAPGGGPDMSAVSTPGVGTENRNELGAGLAPQQKTSNGPSRTGGANGQMRASANPFFDNIRQNTEALSLERSLANLSPVNLPPVPSNYLAILPHYLRSLVALSPMSRADRLARQYYELEAAEKERLEGTFRWHSRYPGGRQEALQEWKEAVSERENRGPGAGAGDAAQDDVLEEAALVEAEADKWERFGISAGLELGNLNRFRNIFPYEHARVHLKEHSPHATDYVNASHLGLRTSSKRFIASQGPLPATFRDFWQMCDQEHVGVIVMLTNLQEGGRDKCGRYWVEQHDGEWDVHVEGDGAHHDEARAAFAPATPAAKPDASPAQDSTGGGGGFFSAFDASKSAPETKVREPVPDATIRRTITVQRKRDGPFRPPRKFRHIQYRAWPDFDIPADPSDVVSLVDEVDAAQREYMREVNWNLDEHDGQEPPILAHCSAGVGRTGVFIMVSSLLDQFRTELARTRATAKSDAMDIDGEGPKPTPTRPGLPERVSDGVTSSLAAGLSDSSLDERARAKQAIAGEQPQLPPVEEPALKQDDPAFAGVNELRGQRMSMVANYRQYVCVLECVLEGALRSLRETGAASS